jgi:phosphohistidine phosphatase
MILYIVRHASAAQAGPPGAEGDDSQRPLTSKGRAKMYRIAQGLRQLTATIDLILSSPYLRATQTARILAKTYELGKEHVVLTDNLTPGASAQDLINEINGRHAGVGNLALVGHQPSLSRLAALLVAGDPGASIELKKGGVCRLSIETLRTGRCATLDWLLTPAQLIEIG